MKQPTTPGVDLAALSDLAPELAETFVSLASDIALVIDGAGVIHNVALGGTGPIAPGSDNWVGRAWADTATGETRAKVEELLREAGLNGISHRREINHPSLSGVDIPVSYAAVRLGIDGPVLAVGRDLRAITGIQQQFVEAQQEIEREYWKHRQAEARYRVLFQVATDAVLVVDAQTLRIIDANIAAGTLFDIALDRLVGMDAMATIDRASRPAVGELLAAARSSGLGGEIRARFAGRRAGARISATPFRSADGMLLLLRVRSADATADAGDANATLVRLVACTPDSVVVTDTTGRVLMANPAFIELAQFADDGHARGRPLAELIADDLADIIALARGRGIAAGRHTTLRGLRGRLVPIEISAALIADEDQECIGLTIRPREAEAAPGAQRRREVTDLASAIDALTGRVGELGMPDLLARVAEQAEQFFVRAALQLADRDHAEAARLLRLTPEQFEARLRSETEPSGKAGDNNAQASE